VPTLAQRVLLIVLALAAGSVSAFEARKIDVQRSGDRYVVELEAHLDAPAEQVGAVLKDYEKYPQLDPRILESRRESAEPAKLYTRLKGCVGGLLCRTMRRVETLQESPESLIATAVPTESDVTYGVTHSQWQSAGTGTEVRYRLEIEPDFWIPPLIGPRLMMKTLREGTLSLFQNVERAANERPPSAQTHDAPVHQP